MPAAMTFMVSIMGTLASVTYIYRKYHRFSPLDVPKWRKQRQRNRAKSGLLFHYRLKSDLEYQSADHGDRLLRWGSGQLFSHGPVFSLEAMKFDLKKLNPIEGIKNKFKLKVLNRTAQIDRQNHRGCDHHLPRHLRQSAANHRDWS